MPGGAAGQARYSFPDISRKDMADVVVPPRDMLLVQSKVRDVIRAKDPTARVSEEYLLALNEELYSLVDRSLARCNDNKRKTLGKADV